MATGSAPAPVAAETGTTLRVLLAPRPRPGSLPPRIRFFPSDAGQDGPGSSHGAVGSLASAAGHADCALRRDPVTIVADQSLVLVKAEPEPEHGAGSFRVMDAHHPDIGSAALAPRPVGPAATARSGLLRGSPTAPSSGVPATLLGLLRARRFAIGRTRVPQLRGAMSRLETRLEGELPVWELRVPPTGPHWTWGIRRVDLQAMADVIRRRTDEPSIHEDMLRMRAPYEFWMPGGSRCAGSLARLIRDLLGLKGEFGLRWLIRRLTKSHQGPALWTRPAESLLDMSYAAPRPAWLDGLLRGLARLPYLRTREVDAVALPGLSQRWREGQGG